MKTCGSSLDGAAIPTMSTLPQMTQAFVLRSPAAHALIKRIDTTAARDMPGVLFVATGEDVHADGIGDIPCAVPLNNRDGTPRHDTPRPALALGKVRHVGQPVALVVAETLSAARDAAEAIDIEYETLPAVTEANDALAPGAPQLFDHIPGNLVFDWDNDMGDAKATDAAFAKAAHVVTLDLVNNRLVANSMEPRNALAEYDPATGRSTLYTGTQGAHFVRDPLADAILKIGKEKLRVISPNVGGGFGMKAFAYPEQALIVWASRKIARPVKWQEDRSEGFVSDNQGRDHLTRAELALDKKGRFLGLRVSILANIGAYLSPFGCFVPTRSTDLVSGIYSIGAIHVNVKGVCTNTVPVCAYRGAGRPEAAYLLERLVDAAARRNRPVAGRYPPGQFRAVLGDALYLCDQAGARFRRVRSGDGPLHDGGGMAVVCEAAQRQRAERQAARYRHGDLYRTLRRRLSGNGVDRIQGRPRRTGHGQPGIRHGPADRVQAGRLGWARHRRRQDRRHHGRYRPHAFGFDRRLTRARGRRRGALRGGTYHHRQGHAARLAYSGSRRGRTWRLKTACSACPAPICASICSSSQRPRAIRAKLPPGMEPGLDTTHHQVPKAQTFPNGCHIVEVEIDPNTGSVAIERYTIVDDFGRTINPMMLEGQVHGGIVQGIGQALLEHAVYDPDSGQLLSGSFMDYAMPRAGDIPRFAFSTHNVPTTANPLGVKGAGEAGAVGAPPAVINAIVDALHRRAGVRHIDMPATPRRVWEKLQGAH